MSSSFRTYYMDDAVFNLGNVIETAQERLAGVNFDTLVGTGFSGSIVVPSLALAMGKKFVLVRKDTDDSHHGGGRLLGDLGSRWIFVDDFVSSGRTRERVMDKLDLAARESEGPTEMVGQYMYVSYSANGPRFEHFESEWLEKY